MHFLCSWIKIKKKQEKTYKYLFVHSQRAVRIARSGVSEKSKLLFSMKQVPVINVNINKDRELFLLHHVSLSETLNHNCLL